MLTRLTIDFETFYSPTIDYSLKVMSIPEYVMDQKFEVQCVTVAKDDDPPVVMTGSYAQIAAWLATFPWETSVCIAHNALFEGAILEWRFGIKPKRYFCTMSGSRPFIAPFVGSMSLDACLRYLRSQTPCTLTKNTAALLNVANRRLSDLTNADIAHLCAYNVTDVNAARALHTWISPQLPDDEQELLHLTVTKFTRPKLVVDIPAAKAALLTEQARRALLISGSGLTPEQLRSDAQFRRALSQYLGSDFDGEPLNKQNPKFKALLLHPNKAVAQIVEARFAVRSSIEPTRLQRLIDIGLCMDGLLPVALTYWAAHTGRWGGTDKTNLQNQPNKSAIRTVVSAPAGYKIVRGDLKQIECRILAVLAEQWDLVDRFARDEDEYSAFATSIYGYAVTQDTHPAERFVGKVGVLSLGYYAGWVRFLATMQSFGVNMDEAMAKRVVGAYRLRYHKIAVLWNTADRVLRDAAVAAGTNHVSAFIERPLGPVTLVGTRLKLPGGMHIMYPNLGIAGDGRITYSKGREAGTEKWGHDMVVANLYGGKVVENAVQALARKVLVEAELRLAKNGLRAVLSAHDELVFVVRDDQVLPVKLAIHLAMSRAPKWMPKLPVAVSVSHGQTYAETK